MSDQYEEMHKSRAERRQTEAASMARDRMNKYERNKGNHNTMSMSKIEDKIAAGEMSAAPLPDLCPLIFITQTPRIFSADFTITE